MLGQIDILLEPPQDYTLYSDFSVKVHGFLMSKINREYGERLHSQNVNPFSIFTVENGSTLLTRVSALDNEACQMLTVFDSLNKITVYGMNSNPQITAINHYPATAVQQLAGLVTKQKLQLCFVTPASYKSAGKVHFTPELASYFTSVILKLNRFENMEITPEQVAAAFDSLVITDYELSAQDYITGGRLSKGMTGTVNVTIPPTANADTRRLLKLLLSYATFSGVGRSTTQGMGGFLIQ